MLWSAGNSQPLWNDLLGASDARLETTDAVLAEYSAGSLDDQSRMVHHWLSRVDCRPSARICPQAMQGMHWALEASEYITFQSSNYIEHVGILGSLR